MTEDFFAGDTCEVAKKLLGCTLRYSSPKGIIGGVINETEAYTQDDPACHAFGGVVTARNRSLFKQGGHLYIYFIYGMYHCANIVTGVQGYGSGVLVRGVIPVEGIDLMKKNRLFSPDLCNGPGKLCQAFGWDRSFDGLNLRDPSSVVTLHLPPSPPQNIRITPRIGISKGKDLPWRFVWKEVNPILPRFPQ